MEEEKLEELKRLFYTDTLTQCGKRRLINYYEKQIEKLQKENELFKHRLEVANDFIESRQENLIPENYDDLKYIINECDLESTW